MRSEFPTPQRRAALRANGIVPYSSSATTLLATSGVVLLVFTWLGPLLQEIVRYASETEGLASCLRVACTRRQDQEAWRALAELLLVPALLVVAVSVLSVTLQTRFLFRPAAWWGDRSGGYRPASLLSRCLSSMLRLALAAALMLPLLAVGYGIVVSAAPDGPHRFAAAARALLPGAMLALLLGAGAATLAARFRFSWQHRMTREEVRREASEER